MAAFHPDLALGRFLPPISVGPRLSELARRLKTRPVAPPPGVTVQELVVPGPPDAPPVSLRVFRPAGATDAVPALLWIHGGGLVLGSPEQDDQKNIDLVRDLGIVVAAVRYRLAPADPAPAAVEDVYAGLRGLVARAGELGVDPGRIAVGGASAGGGLAAAVSLLAHDRGEVRPVFQLLVYPMLDDRTVTRPDLDTLTVRIWTARSNRFGWTSYLGREPGGPGVSPYSAPARREDLTGLPPAWIGVGTLDLFHDEDVAYARRLEAAGVPCELEIVPGAFHGFDALFSKAEVSLRFGLDQTHALRKALFA
ncbi:acetyl esterase/lipase [Pseudonocardia sediminis]|uniref:Acetyl esterase/lipase n=1 Tax=Pseudonocardia sediminis TaxID=1397368 RepID=A0A4Q7V4W8_PSEST|nr:alpha/beta hydrolase [Pseudonocardia sediminis]RZT87803.1 acetyl esterase/lipase [Pseudonocardia sediminis]